VSEKNLEFGRRIQRAMQTRGTTENRTIITIKHEESTTERKQWRTTHSKGTHGKAQGTKSRTQEQKGQYYNNNHGDDNAATTDNAGCKRGPHKNQATKPEKGGMNTVIKKAAQKEHTQLQAQLEWLLFG